MKDVDQKIPSLPNCDNYGIYRVSNPNPLNNGTKTNDNELHQWLCKTFQIDYGNGHYYQVISQIRT